MNAWTFAGAYDVDSVIVPGTKVRMIGYGQALGYADWALKQTQDRGSGRVAWLMEKDTLTRGVMVNHQRRGYPAGEALQLALVECKADWREKDAHVPPPPKREWPGSPGGKGARDDKRRRTEDNTGRARMEASPKGKSKGEEKVLTVSTFPGGSKACKPWNDGRKCENRSCRDEHSCDRLLKSTNKACRGRHPRVSCRG